VKSNSKNLKREAYQAKRKRLYPHQVKWLKQLKKEFHRCYIIGENKEDTLTAFIYSEGGFLVEERNAPKNTSTT